ncbi:glycosyltransferase family 4 protein [Aeromonas caviae]
MRVVFCIRSNWKSSYGGDITQMLSTKAELERHHEVEVVVCDHPEELRTIKPDIVHVFNMQTLYESMKYLDVAEELGVPKFLSPIYWDLEHAYYVSLANRFGINSGGIFFKSCFYFARKLFKISSLIFGKPLIWNKNYIADEKAFLSRFDCLLPNSTEEYDIIRERYDIDIPCHVVVNAIDNDIFSFNREEIKYDVMCAARLEPLKNQLSIAKALALKNCKTNSSANRVLFVGGVNSNRNASYKEKIEKICNGNIDIIDATISQKELAKYYSSSRVHVLASFRESPGLSSLEALACGCNIVISDIQYCPVNTYFTDMLDKHVFICDPYSVSSINSAIDKALSAPLPQFGEGAFHWYMAASQTFSAYRKFYNKT